jgi:hypothetical protein
MYALMRDVSSLRAAGGVQTRSCETWHRLVSILSYAAAARADAAKEKFPASIPAFRSGAHEET